MLYLGNGRRKGGREEGSKGERRKEGKWEEESSKERRKEGRKGNNVGGKK